MEELRFQINGITRRQARRLRRLTQPPNAAVRICAWLVAGGISVYGIGTVLPNIAAIVSGSPSAVIHGKLFLGNHVLLIRDGSRSMRGTEKNLQKQIDKLKASGMAIEGREGRGFGVSRKGSRDNLLHQVEAAIQANPDLDTVYAFSDFEVIDRSYWKSDRAGYRQLETLLVRHGVRLYLGTVRYPPPTELVVIARESGGGLIR